LSGNTEVKIERSALKEWSAKWKSGAISIYGLEPRNGSRIFINQFDNWPSTKICVYKTEK
jgi:hypothetical protein